jgi:hypothetical protein
VGWGLGVGFPWDGPRPGAPFGASRAVVGAVCARGLWWVWCGVGVRVVGVERAVARGVPLELFDGCVPDSKEL